MDGAILAILAVAALLFAWLYRLSSRRIKLFTQIYVLCVLGVFLLVACADRYIYKLQRAEFLKMNDAQHLAAAQQAFKAWEFDVASKHVEAVTDSSPEVRKERIFLRRRIELARDTESVMDAIEGNEFDFLDSLSFMSHRKEMVVAVGANWPQGEYRDCEIVRSDPPDTLKWLDCVGGFHKNALEESTDGSHDHVRMDVIFDDSMKESLWECKHRQDDILCTAKK
jgi:hypothetical protein